MIDVYSGLRCKETGNYVKFIQTHKKGTAFDVLSVISHDF